VAAISSPGAPLPLCEAEWSLLSEMPSPPVATMSKPDSASGVMALCVVDLWNFSVPDVHDPSFHKSKMRSFITLVAAGLIDLGSAGQVNFYFDQSCQDFVGSVNVPSFTISGYVTGASFLSFVPGDSFG